MIWFTGEPELLAPTARDAIVDAEEVLVSVATIWEIAIKAELGKLQAPVDDLPDELAEWGFELLPIAGAHAWHTRSLPAYHRDPFDRLLVAQAQLEGLTIVSRDPQISRYPVAVLVA